MASVPSLDKDLKNLRLEKYTPQRAKEAREWIEGALRERLNDGDLLEALKDGVALCKLINAVVGAGAVKIKQSAMPFVQMEQISHFLRACQSPPLNLPQHDCFLTVDLYERKDPAQVIQCIGAFSRRAAALHPTRFPSGIGGMKASNLSPQASGSDGRGTASPGPNGRNNPTKGVAASPPGASTWAKKSDVHSTAPAWNIAQYGWTGGASQGNQGVTFGGRRQIVSSQPAVPSLADKERRRKEQEAESQRQAQQAEEHRRTQQAQIEEEERLVAEEEARRWDEQAKLHRDQERQAAEEEKRRWQAEEQKWKEEEEQRLREEKEAEERAERERNSKPKLYGQTLSEYQAEQKQSRATQETNRIKELEAKLAAAEERERKYEAERLKRQPTGSSQQSSMAGRQTPSAKQEAEPPVQNEWDQDSERSFLRQHWNRNQQSTPSQPRPLPVPGAQAAPPPRPLPIPGKKPTFPASSQTTTSSAALNEPPKSPRPLPDPSAAAGFELAPTEEPPSISRPLSQPVTVADIEPPRSPRPLPNPSTYVPPPQAGNRTGRFLSSNPAPVVASTASVTPSEAAFNSSAEQAAEDTRRVESQQKTKAGGWAAKSLIEREMEADLARAREWEESQKATQAAAARGDTDTSAGSGPGQGFNTSQYGFLGGDNLNKGGGGVYSGRRQIMGPRTMGNK